VPLLAHGVDVADDLVELTDLDEPADRVQLVGELVGLGAQHVGGRAERADLALEVGQRRAVAHRRHRAQHAVAAHDLHRVHDEHVPSTDDDLVARLQVVVVRLVRRGAARVLADEHLAQPALDAQVVDRHAHGVLGEVEQLAGDLVDEGDPVLGVERDDPLGDAAQHRLPVFGETGDLTRLHAAGLPLDPPGEQPRADEADDERDPQVDEQVGRRALEPLPRGRHPLGDHDGAEVRAHGILRLAEHRHLRHEVVHALELEDARPAGPSLDPRVADRQLAPLQRRVGGDPDVEVGLGEAHGGDRGLGHQGLREGGQPGAGAGLGEAGAHERAAGDLLGEPRHPAALDALERRCGLGQRHGGHGHEDGGDDGELEGEQLPRQRPATPPAHDHYELNLLC
jgi:hypothetical protein